MKTAIKRAAWALVGAAVLAGLGRAYWAREAQRSQVQAQALAAQAPVTYQLSHTDTVRAVQGTLVQSVAVSGTLEAAVTAVIKARVAGEIQGLTVREGDTVKAGEVLARTDSTEPTARLQQARQQAQAAAAQVDTAQRQFDNNRALVTQGFISATALETTRANLDAAEANHRAALAAVALAEKALADTVLRSPLDGTVSARLAQNGERLGVDARLLEVVATDTLEAEVTLPAADAATVRVGQTAALRTEGAADTVAARVVRINPAAQANNRAVVVYLSTEPTPGLRHGLFVTGHIATGELSGVLVPRHAVRMDKPQPYVQELVPVADGWQVKHTPVEWQGEGHLLEPHGNRNMVPQGPTYVALKGIAASAILASAEAGFIQENSRVQLPHAEANAAVPASAR